MTLRICPVRVSRRMRLFAHGASPYLVHSSKTFNLVPQQVQVFLLLYPILFQAGAIGTDVPDDDIDKSGALHSCIIGF